MDAYAELERLTLPLIEHYHADLTTHDKREIAANPGTPFLHWTSDFGTHLIFLPPASEYPKFGETVPYLFGHAGREHVLREKVNMAEHFTKPANSPHKYTCHYFNGFTVRCVSVQRAVEIAKAYSRPIEVEWHNEWLRNTRPWEYKSLRDAGKLATS